MLVPEFKMLAISPLLSPKIKRQIKRTRSQRARFGMASSGVFSYCRQQKTSPAISPLCRKSQGQPEEMPERGKMELILTVIILYTFSSDWQEAKKFFCSP
jgi:hypothetical protein